MANSADFNAHYDNNFDLTKRQRGRGKWYVNPKTGELCEQPGDWHETDGERVPVMTDLYMDGVAATDGTDIGSRVKRRRYMKEHNLADADDFKNEWAAKAKDREEGFPSQDKARREAVDRAFYDVFQKGR
jgi:hypothetical protein